MTRCSYPNCDQDGIYPEDNSIYCKKHKEVMS